MVLRVFGLKQESDDNYGEDIPSQTQNLNVDWHKNVSKGSFALNDEPITMGDGSRMNQRARAGAMKPTGSIESKVDLKRIGHTMKAFLDQYKFTAADGETTTLNTHEFYGAESSDLTSFKGVATYDEFQKMVNGLLLDSMKLEVSDEMMTLSEDWIYKTQIIKPIDQSQFHTTSVEGDIPIMFYDVSVKFDDNTPPGVVSSFTFEGKNNLAVDSTVGLGSRAPQCKAQAQKRELSQTVVSTLRPQTVEFIKKAEHGEDSITPSACKLYKLCLEIDISVCEKPEEYMKIIYPECLVSVEYEASESDEIETTFNLSSLGSGEVTLADKKTKVVTDMYVKLVNDVSEIKA